MLDASKFGVDLRYQREPEARRSHLQKMADDFRPEEFGVLHVTKRDDGTTVFIDGAGRGYAYYTLMPGNAGKRVRCIEHPKMPLADEARLFVRLNRFRKAVNSGDMFKADVAAKDKEAVAIQKVFDTLAMTIGHLSGPLNIASVQSVKNLYRVDPDLLTRSLAIKKTVWSAEVCGGGLLEGIGLFLRAVPNLDEMGFRKVLQDHPPLLTMDWLRVHCGRGRMPLKRYIPQFAAEYWADLYNVRRKKNRADLRRIKLVASTKPGDADEE
jgi:hypothetical protein